MRDVSAYLKTYDTHALKQAVDKTRKADRARNHKIGDVPAWQIRGAKLSSELRGGVDEHGQHDWEKKINY